jgi:uncharacterized membrane protein
MIIVTFYYRQDSELCEKVGADLNELQKTIPHQLVKVDVDLDKLVKEHYGEDVPVVQVGPYLLKYPISKQDLTVALSAANDRVKHLEGVKDETYQQRYQRGHSMSRTDRFSFWLSKHYMSIINFVIFLYVGLPFLAPVLMKASLPGPAKVIYTIYSPLCHQLAFRSWFLFGEQAYYPRQLADISGVITYEQLTNQNSFDIVRARQFIGNGQVGYKVAICERDVAIYGALLLFGIIFSLTGKRLKSFPWYIWIAVGLVPIGIDGVSQLPALTSLSLPAWIPIRESTPFLRTLTGGLFGFTTAWYLYPLIEESMRESYRILVHKTAVVKQTQTD